MKLEVHRVQVESMVVNGTMTCPKKLPVAYLFLRVTLQVYLVDDEVDRGLDFIGP